jgi:hypothetical protein
MFFKDNKIYCFNDTGYFERNLDDFDEVENRENIFLLKNDLNEYTNSPTIDLYI